MMEQHPQMLQTVRVNGTHFFPSTGQRKLLLNGLRTHTWSGSCEIPLLGQPLVFKYILSTGCPMFSPSYFLSTNELTPRLLLFTPKCYKIYLCSASNTKVYFQWREVHYTHLHFSTLFQLDWH
uniref:Uncharacterized protein n=1 Tax=Myotis myotis TaxID=51298 RepID=A0A7J7ZYI6_MYOMY|nr:hypothetical protein mMyoMyo1_009819 [Myotis myotis]